MCPDHVTKVVRAVPPITGESGQCVLFREYFDVSQNLMKDIILRLDAFDATTLLCMHSFRGPKSMQVKDISYYKLEDSFFG